jgi:hypothetical protein
MHNAFTVAGTVLGFHELPHNITMYVTLDTNLKNEYNQSSNSSRRYVVFQRER